MTRERNTQTIYFVIVGVLLAVIFFYFSRRVLTPFFIAFALAYLLDPVTDRLESLKISRTFAVLVLMAGVFSLVTGIGLLIFPLLKLQAEHLVFNLPNYIAIMQEWMYPLLGVVGEPEKIQGILNRELLKVGELPLKVISSVTSILWGSVAGLFSFILLLANLVIIPVVMFYLLRDYDLINKKMLSFVPARSREQVLRLIKEIDGVLAGFVRGQLIVGLIMAGLYSIGLFFCGTPMSLFIGLLAGLASLVPYLGLVFGFVPAAILTFMQTQDWVLVFGVAGVFAVVQGLEGMIITPRIVGEKIGLHPVAIILAVLLGAEFFGLVGIIVSVPVAAALNVLFTHGLNEYKSSSFYTS
ncbi:AI-2E family transporter [Nitrospinaceae bacterium]|nr:AI-2E family transporter [Nitrospinaceae bacterium]